MTLRTTLRSLLRQWRFSGLVAITIGLGIGTATTAYAILDALLLRPLPYQEPDQLVRLESRMSGPAGNASGFSLADFEDLRRTQRCLTELAAYIQFDNNLTGHGTSQAVKMTFATPHLFGVLGVRAVLGRTFTDAEDREGGDVRQLVLSHGLWQSYFGGDRRVLGKTVRLRGDTYTVIGVMPPGFRYPDRADVWCH
ncbi:MAG: ABC transporter permease [Bryobacterales bacterium]|nr:ABC transporter permease [Bryobacterales bacterium]